MRRRLVHLSIAVFYVCVLLKHASASPIDNFRIYLNGAPANPLTSFDDATFQNKLLASGVGSAANRDAHRPVVYLVPSKTTDELSARLQKAGIRMRRSKQLGQTSALDYVTLWPLLNAAKDRTVASPYGSRRWQTGNQRQQSITKRQEWTIREPEERLARFSRNLPEQEKLYQIRNVGDLPMFRFG